MSAKAVCHRIAHSPCDAFAFFCCAPLHLQVCEFAHAINFVRTEAMPRCDGRNTSFFVVQRRLQTRFSSCTVAGGHTTATPPSPRILGVHLLQVWSQVRSRPTRLPCLSNCRHTHKPTQCRSYMHQPTQFPQLQCAHTRNVRDHSQTAQSCQGCYEYTPMCKPTAAQQGDNSHKVALQSCCS